MNDGSLTVSIATYLDHPSDFPPDVQEAIQADQDLNIIASSAVYVLARITTFRLNAQKLTPESEAEVLTAITNLNTAVRDAQTVPDSQPDANPTPATPKSDLHFDYPQA